MRKNIKKQLVSFGLIATMAIAVTPVNTKAAVINYKSGFLKENNALSGGVISDNTVAGKINIDTDLSDWDNIIARKSTIDSVSEWKAALSADASVLYFSYTGNASTEWDYNYLGNNKVNIAYSDGKNNTKSNMIQFSGWKDTVSIKDGWYSDIVGAEIVTENTAHGNTAGPYTVEAAIPMSFFANSDFNITFAGTTIDISELQVMSGEEQTQEKTEPVYNGITIDGTFKDWDAVTKESAGCSNESHPDCLLAAAMVFDGDNVYIYIKDGENGDASGAGSHSNGQYSVKTDLGNELVFQLTRDGSINGIESAQCKHVGSEWEISIPKSLLPAYRQTISFGPYLEEPFVKDVANLDGSDGNVPEAVDITYDGMYGDWTNYPHTTIQYATSGTHNEVADGSAALYSSGSTMFGHVYTEMPAHLDEKGGEFSRAVTIRFNSNDNQTFYPRFAAVDQNGNINWNAQTSNLADGTYEFYIFSLDAWGTSKNISELNAQDQWYGKMKITVGENRDECEYYIDLEKVAAKLGCDASDFKVIEAQYGRIGQQWIKTAGASSGAWLGIALCIIVAGGVLVYRKKKGESKAESLVNNQ